jgi:hypothetical protein
MTGLWRRALIFVAVAALAVSLAAMLRADEGRHQPGESHWYDHACCSLRDCYPVVGEVRVTPRGYEFPGGQVARTCRVSKDHRWHICTNPSGAMIVTSDGKPCCYAPPQSF